MSQTSLDDDELFGEAADDLRSDIEASLAEARAALPDPDAVWETDADNVVGVLNGLRAAMDPGDAEDHLRDARKWYTMGERADAFDEDLEAEIEAVAEVIEELAATRDGISDLAGTIPQLRSELEEVSSGAGGTDAGGGETEAASDGGRPDDQATLED